MNQLFVDQVKPKEAQEWFDSMQKSAHIEFPFTVAEVTEGVTVTTNYIQMWRTPSGKHYEAQLADVWQDKSVACRSDVDIHFTAIGFYPDFGRATISSYGQPMTEIDVHYKTQFVWDKSA